MADVTTNAGSLGSVATTKTETANTANATAQAPITEAEKPVTLTDLKTILSDFRNGVNADIRRATDPAKLLEAFSPKKEPAKEPDTLSTRVKAIEERENAQRERERFAQVRDALKNNGVPENRAAREAKLLLIERGEHIKTDDDFTVHFAEGENKTGIADWISAYMQTDEGKLINPQPAPNVPTAKGMSGAAKNGTAASMATSAGKLTYADLMKPSNAAIAGQMRRENLEMWTAKRDEHFAAKTKR